MYTWLNSDHTLALRHRDRANVSYTPLAEGNTDYAELKAHIEGGGEPDEFVPAPLTEADYEAAIQAHVDATARGKRYRDGVTCASYAASEAFGAEAIAFIAWRDAVWIYSNQQLEAVQNGQRPQPTIAELIAELNPINWPA